MCTIECARCEATFTVSEELCGECDEALDVVWAERLGANLVAAGLAAMLVTILTEEHPAKFRIGPGVFLDGSPESLRIVEYYSDLYASPQ